MLNPDPHTVRLGRQEVRVLQASASLLRPYPEVPFVPEYAVCSALAFSKQAQSPSETGKIIHLLETKGVIDPVVVGGQRLGFVGNQELCSKRLTHKYRFLNPESAAENFRKRFIQLLAKQPPLSIQSIATLFNISLDTAARIAGTK